MFPMQSIRLLSDFPLRCPPSVAGVWEPTPVIPLAGSGKKVGNTPLGGTLQAAGDEGGQDNPGLPDLSLLPFELLLPRPFVRIFPKP